MIQNPEPCYAMWQENGERVTCGKPSHATGLCTGHYTQRARGKPFRPLQKRRAAHAN